MLTSILSDATVVVPQLDINQLINLLLGPVGLTVGCVFVVLQFASDRWLTAKRSDAQATKVEEIWRERYDEMKADRDQAIEIAEKAVSGYTSVADAIKERNRLDALRLRSLQVEDTARPDETDPVTAEVRRTEHSIRTRRSSS